MSYIFNPDGETLATVVSRVIDNSFGVNRYAELAKAYINDGVDRICERLELFPVKISASYDENGAVDTGAAILRQVDDVWVTTTSDPSTIRYGLVPMRPNYTGILPASSTPLGYTISRTVNGRTPSVAITIVGGNAPGFLAIRGIQRPPVAVEGTDSLGLPTDLIEAVVAHAKARCFENEDDAEMAMYWEQRFDAALRNAAYRETKDGPDILPGSWS